METPTAAASPPPIPQKLTANAQQQLMVLSESITRGILAARQLGMSFNGARDIYLQCGYPKILTFDQLYSRYRRQDMARRVVDAYPNATWSLPPSVYEDEDPNVTTPFEEAWNDLVDDMDIWFQLLRIDKLCGIGRYGVMMLGFDDGEDLNQPVEKASKLVYVQPYTEGNAAIVEWENDPKTPRYGLPVVYLINTITGNAMRAQRVHWSRVLHVADNVLESCVYGDSRMEVPYNRLQDIETITGGSSEMYWRGGFPGIAFEADADADLSTQGKDEMQDEIYNYIHGLQRFLRLQGVKANQLSPNIADPTGQIDMLVGQISSGTGIPKRVLLGSEQGELASTQDRENWLDRVDERRGKFAEKTLLKGFINKMVEVGVLPMPKNGLKKGYKVSWPELKKANPVEESTIKKTKTDALVAYSNSPAAQQIIPSDFYLTKFLELTDDELKTLKEMVAEQMGVLGTDTVDLGSGKEQKETTPAPPPDSVRGAVAGTPTGEDIAVSPAVLPVMTDGMLVPPGIQG